VEEKENWGMCVRERERERERERRICKNIENCMRDREVVWKRTKMRIRNENQS